MLVGFRLVWSPPIPVTVTSVTSSASNGYYKSGSVIPIQICFSKPVNVTGIPQLTLETGTTDTVVNYVSGSGTDTLMFSYTVAAGHNSNDLDYVSAFALVLNGGTIGNSAGAKDGYVVLTLPKPGYAGSLGANKAIVIDTNPPTLTLSSGTSSVTNVSPFKITATFSESVTGFASGDISVTNGSVSGFSGSGNTYDFYVTPAANGSVTVNVPSNAAQDSAGNLSTAAAALSRTYDGIKPTVTLSSGTSSVTNVSPFKVTATFSESVTGFASGDISVTNGSVSGFSGSGNTYDFYVTPAANGSVTVNVPSNAAQDSAGNLSTAAAALSRTYDGIKPTVTLSSGTSSVTNVSPFKVTATFSESVTGFASGDISVTNGSVSGFSGSGNTYDFYVTPAANGLVTVNVPANASQDSAGNGNAAATELTRTYDTNSPIVALSSDASDPVNSSFSVTVTFSESVTGFELADINISNGSSGNFMETETGRVYTFDITPAEDGEVRVNIPANAAQDSAGNGNIPTTELSRTYDGTAPTVVLTSDASDPVNNSFSVTATFSESVTGFELADITVSNGSAGNFMETETGRVYTFDITPAENGDVTVNIPENAAQDSAGNGNTATTGLTRTYVP